MTLIALSVALAGIAGTGLGGYLLGVLLGRRSRRALQNDAALKQLRVEQLEHALAQSSTAAAGQVRELLAPLLGQQQASTQQLREQMQQIAGRLSADDRKGETVEVLRQELHRTLAPMLERDREQKGLRQLVLDVMGPFMENERRAQGLKTVAAPKRGREQLPALLDTIARRGGFAAVLLSDEVGLPLAASSGARDAEVLAGVSSLILSLADRVTKTGGPTPTAVLVRDTANQIILHRIFTAGGERFLVTAVSKGEVSSTALDPALTALENVLGKNAA